METVNIFTLGFEYVLLFSEYFKVTNLVLFLKIKTCVPHFLIIHYWHEDEIFHRISYQLYSDKVYVPIGCCTNVRGDTK